MSSRLPVCTATDVIRALQRAGWRLKRSVGSHRYFEHPTQRGLICVPFHRGRDLKRGTLHGIIADTGLTVDEFIELLRG